MASNQDFVTLSAASGLSVSAGAGDDFYTVSAGRAKMAPGQKVKISDTDGINTLILEAGVTIASSQFAGNAVLLTLDNGAQITLLSAQNFKFELAGTPLVPAASKTFAEFATALGVAALPAAGAPFVSGAADVGVNPNGTTTAEVPVVVAPTFTVAAASTVVPEGQSAAFTVTASAAVTADTVFSYSTAGVGADVNDFTGPTSGNVTILAGQTSATFSIAIKANDELELAESFAVTVKNSAGTVVGTTMTVDIQDATTDTTAPVVTAAQTFKYFENQDVAGGHIVGTVLATDAVGVTAFEITTGNDAGYFAIDAATGVITLTEAGAAAGVAADGTTAAVPPSAANDFETGANTFILGVVAKDAAGNASAAANVTINVEDVDDVAPQLVAATLAGTTLKLNFDEALKAGVLTASAFTVVDAANASITVSSVAISGSSVTLNLAATPSGATKVSYTPPATGDELQDAAGNKVAAIVNKVTVTDATAPTLVSSSPADDSTAVAKGANVVLTFSENVVLGTGNITLTNAANPADSRTLSVTDTTQVSVAGAVVTLNPTADLTDGASYYVSVPATAVLDAAGNAFVGISSTTALNFTVAPTVVVVPEAGKSFTLTTGNDGPGAIAPAVDTTGTESNDTYSAVLDSAAANSSLNAGDVIRGAGGTGDVLNVTVTDTATNNGYPADFGAADIQGVEIFNIRNTDATAYGLNAALFPGLTNINSDRGTGGVTLTNVSNTQQVGATGNGSVTVGALMATSVATATTSTLNLNGGLQTSLPGAALAGAGAVALNGAALTTATVNSTGTANVVADLDYAGGAALTTLNIKADANFGLAAGGSISGFAAGAAITTINVTGAGAVTVNALDANVDIYNASTATGAQTLTIGAVAQAVTTGSGNDVITTGGVQTGAVAAGAGTADRLVVAVTGHLTAVSGARFSGFEVVQAADAASVDLDFLAATNTITGVRIADGAGATGATNMNATQAANVAITSANATGAITLDVKGAGGLQTDTIKATLSTTDAAGVAQAINLTGIVLANIEKLELTGNGTVAATTGIVTLTTTAALALESIKLTNVGGTVAAANIVTIAAGHTASNLLVDASASTGANTLDASLYNVTGADLRGGSGNDDILGSVRADQLKGGGGRDVFQFTSASTAAAMDKISDFGKVTVAAVDTGTFANIQNAGVTAGGVDADIIDFVTVVTGPVLSAAVAAPVDVALAAGNATLNITATLSARGVITLAGTDKAQIDTVAEFIAVAQTAGLGIAATAGGVAVFELNGNTYVFQESDGAGITTDEIVELTGVTGVTGVALVGVGGNTALVGEILVG